MRGWVKVLCAVGALSVFAAHAARIASVSPQGEVAQVRQVVVTFSEPVVPLGDLRLPDPMDLSCQGDAPEGDGRWVDGRIWVYDFQQALPPGVRCTLQLRSDWRPTGGATLTGKAGFAFGTGGPAVVSLRPWPGGEIAEDQYFVLRLNGAAAAATIEANAWCEAEGIGEKLGVRIVTGAARDGLLKAQHIAAAQAATTVVLGCQRPLPPGVAVRLVWGKGIATASEPRVVTRLEQAWRFRVREAFTAEFSCQRERAQAPCIPIRPVVVRFSAPVPRALAEQVRLRLASPAPDPGASAPAGTVYAPVFDKDDAATAVREVAFPNPLPSNAMFSLELPRDLQDDAGRPLANAASFPLPVETGEAPPIAKFASAPFGVVELHAQPGSPPMLPVTLRHVQGDLGPSASGGRVRVRRVHSDAEILAWYAKLQRYDETRLTAQELGWPQKDWYTFEERIDAQGRTVRDRVERYVATREVSLLNQDTQARRLDLPQLAGADARAFEVVGIPLREPGYHVVEIESLRLGQSLLDRRAPMFVRTGVLVTNLGVHVKHGRANSVVWVTTLDRGQPVEGAAVAINDCNGRRLWSGTTDAQGLARVPQALDADAPRCEADAGLFVTARKAIKGTDGQTATDVAFVFSSWQKGIEPWRFNVPTRQSAEPDLRAHTVFDRPLFRAGETVSMKHFVRVETLQGLADLATSDLPTQMRIVHEGSGQEFVQPLQWRGVRSASSTWEIPPGAKLGAYSVVLERDARDPALRRRWPSGSLRVEEFRLPLVDARVSGPKAVAVAPATVPFELQLNYFSGGGMSQVPAQASALLKRRTLHFDGYEDFSFEPPRELQVQPSAADEESGDHDTADNDAKLVADKLPLTTDRQGAARFAIDNLGAIDRASELLAEVSFNDPNGEVQTVSSAVALWPSAVVLGVKAESWARSRGKVKFTALALDTSGRVRHGQRIEVHGRLARTISTRKRMVGGFYAYDNRTETRELGVLCSGTTDERGLLLCAAELATPGQVELIARAKDAAGHAVQAAASVWVVGRGELWFAQDNDDRMDVLPERRRYEPGQTARLQVRMPFREATALLAIEREGVIETRVVQLRGDDPTVDVTIGKDWGPNVYVSVFALRGRILETPWYSLFTWGWREPLNWVRSFWYGGHEYQAPTAMIDLAKPAFKLGVAALQVGMAAHELQVSVTPDKPQYTVRQRATARIKVRAGGQPLAGAQVAFAAVDEGLLALRPNDSWDLLDAMFRPRPWGVETSTGQSEIIGRRHYGRKAVAAGGGGGHAATRELFNTLLLWRADVPLDANGEAVVEVPLNDSLTSFRLVAIADAGGQRFGSGSARVRVTQDLQLLSGLPPLVRDGDRFAAMLTVRNTTAREMPVRASLNGVAHVPSGSGAAFSRLPVALPAQDVVVAAGAAVEVVWPVDVPAEAFSIAWEATALEGGGAAPAEPASDRLKVTQLVAPAVPTQVLQSTLQQLDGHAALPVAAPADALPRSGGVKRGGIAVGAQARLTGALPGIRRYFEAYPFTCLEQQASKAMGLHDAALWASVVNALPTYLDSDGLASYFPLRAQDGARGSDRLTAYLLAATHEAGFELPAPSRDAMLDGLAAFVQGRIERRFWSPRPDLAVRKLAAIEALSRYGRAQAQMLGSVQITPTQWPTAAVIDWLNILRRVDGIAQREQRLAEAGQILRSRLTYAGTTLTFSREEEDFWWWLMDSPDANAARLILAVLEDPAWRDELPRMVLGSLGRQRGGAWLTTTANLWGALALDKFSQRFESAAVNGRTVAALGGQSAAIDWASPAADRTLMLPWPAGQQTLDVTHDGTGKPWLTVQSLAAVPLAAPVHAGYRVVRSVSPVQRQHADRWSRGDIVRVHLEVEAQGDMTWVVISDPVPAGATILGSGLGRDSAIGTRTEQREGDAWPAYQERSFEAWRSYYEFLPRGRHVAEYTMRLNNPGHFLLPPTRVEALYAPESFGAAPNAPIEVSP